MEDILASIKGIKPLDDKIILVGYELDDGSKFYLEHAFLTQLTNLFHIRKNDIERITNAIVKTVQGAKRVYFVHDYENPIFSIEEDYIILEIEDILDPLGIFVENKSRGSDYGD